MKEFKFFPRKKDRKPETEKEIIEKETNNNKNWKKKSFNSKKQKDELD